MPGCESGWRLLAPLMSISTPTIMPGPIRVAHPNFRAVPVVLWVMVGLRRRTLQGRVSNLKRPPSHSDSAPVARASGVSLMSANSSLEEAHAESFINSRVRKPLDIIFEIIVRVLENRLPRSSHSADRHTFLRGLNRRWVTLRGATQGPLAGSSGGNGYFSESRVLTTARRRRFL